MAPLSQNPRSATEWINSENTTWQDNIKTLTGLSLVEEVRSVHNRIRLSKTQPNLVPRNKFLQSWSPHRQQSHRSVPVGMALNDVAKPTQVSKDVILMQWNCISQQQWVGCLHTEWHTSPVHFQRTLRAITDDTADRQIPSNTVAGKACQTHFTTTVVRTNCHGQEYTYFYCT